MKNYRSLQMIVALLVVVATAWVMVSCEDSSKERYHHQANQEKSNVILAGTIAENGNSSQVQMTDVKIDGRKYKLLHNYYGGVLLLNIEKEELEIELLRQQLAEITNRNLQNKVTLSQPSSIPSVQEKPIALSRTYGEKVLTRYWQNLKSFAWGPVKQTFLYPQRATYARN